MVQMKGTTSVARRRAPDKTEMYSQRTYLLWRISNFCWSALISSLSFGIESLDQEAGIDLLRLPLRNVYSFVMYFIIYRTDPRSIPLKSKLDHLHVWGPRCFNAEEK